MRCGKLTTLDTVGFDASLMASVNALPNYTRYFGLPAKGNASTGITFAIFQVSTHCPDRIRLPSLVRS